MPPKKNRRLPTRQLGMLVLPRLKLRKQTRLPGMLLKHKSRLTTRPLEKPPKHKSRPTTRLPEMLTKQASRHSPPLPARSEFDVLY